MDNWYFSAKPASKSTVDTRREYRRQLFSRFEEQSSGKMSTKVSKIAEVASEAFKGYRSDVVNAILLARHTTKADCSESDCLTREQCLADRNTNSCGAISTLKDALNIVRRVRREYGSNNNSNAPLLLKGGKKHTSSTKTSSTKRPTTKRPTTKTSSTKRPTTKTSSTKTSSTKTSSTKTSSTKRPITKTSLTKTKKPQVTSKVLKQLLTRVGL